MYKFSERSLKRLETCHEDLQRIMHEVIKIIDITIIEGERSVETQKRYVRQGVSRRLDSLHVNSPSLAVDIALWPYAPWDREALHYMAGVVKAIAVQLNIPIRWGGDWDSDNDFKDEVFSDLFHFELVGY